MPDRPDKDVVRWGMIGCGSVAEVKAGPALQKASGSSLVAVTSRTIARARDYAKRHDIGRVHTTAAELIADPDVDVIYIATPPASHCELALAAAAGHKACLVEKPMARTHAECARMVSAFEEAGCPLWVAYYRRALPRYLLVRDLLRDDAIGRITSLHIEVFEPLASPDRAASWRFDPAIAGGGLFFDLGSHTLDMVDFLVGPVDDVHAVVVNTGGAYRAEDAVTASFRAGGDVCGTGVWNFHADRTLDRMTVVGTRGTIAFPMFSDGEVVLSGATNDRFSRPNPPHVHQPLIQTIVDELRGNGRCEATAASAARTAAVLDRCVAAYYAGR
jgi:1,5-anhydro-D-fructose reductase (1,5-anhydro-D-mannitol-forming)